MLPECSLRRTLLTMDNHLPDDEFADQLMTLPQDALSLQPVAMRNHWAQPLGGRSVGRSLTFKSNKNRQEKEHHWSEVFWRIEIECIDNFPARAAPDQRYGSVGLNSSEIDPDSIDPLKKRFQCSFLRGV
jgi:hypothetical protein